jgi:hypothetical protein
MMHGAGCGRSDPIEENPMFRKSTSRRVAYRYGLALAAAVVSSTPAWADHGFQDCGIVDHSHASPFVQSRAQLTLLNLIGSTGSTCNLIEFRIAEMAQLPTESDREGVKRRWWKELWGLNQCGVATVYEVWFQEIGLGGVSFSAEPLTDPPADFLARMAAGTPLPPDEMVVTNEDGTAPQKAGANLETDYLAIARAAVAAKDVAKTIVAQPAAQPVDGDTEANLLAIAKAAVAKNGDDKTIVAAPAARKAAAAVDGPLFPGRELKFKSPNFKGHDVCAIQRALIGEDISVGVDGHYGPGMKRGVARFQKRQGLKRTGIFDEKTRAALSFPAAGKNSAEKKVAKKKTE